MYVIRNKWYSDTKWDFVDNFRVFLNRELVGLHCGGHWKGLFVVAQSVFPGHTVGASTKPWRMLAFPAAVAPSSLLVQSPS